ncbi:hypothetical protein EMIHUDRAFT_453530 [Emiliania huxleyi CCMP1516]|uniref:NADH dehydrogenase [ubiquinone] 1 alpha subcomplex subunit 11 n=2 Tax=Emiliania huxleyi TaxID=2903 RepID=A0A0D3I4I5_EMIH1|nr:hypothetical protein EMIHUDRAFT_453530 [Emiliania huxleyi CCMP1516]EOD06170.1 hypothetical protein EMIHUDRAFT_453530 [Emiliania huxleyi CCMP1516]|eukprot:XP_005758599.1 hypothetical protein EMIHUDRAFT_453530 [Emiliania huxleyi CCMP1516]
MVEGDHYSGQPRRRAPSEAEPELVRDTVTTAAAGACLGAVVGAAESAWKLNRGPAPLTDAARLMGSHAALLGTIGAVFAATEAGAHMVNGPSDANVVAAGCVAGTLPGLRASNLGAAFAGCLLFGGAQALGVFKSYETAEH